MSPEFLLFRVLLQRCNAKSCYYLLGLAKICYVAELVNTAFCKIRARDAGTKSLQIDARQQC